MVSIHESSCFSSFYYLCTLSSFCHPCSVMLYCACFFSPVLRKATTIRCLFQPHGEEKNKIKWKKFKRWKNSSHNAQQSQTYMSCPLPGTRLKNPTLNFSIVSPPPYEFAINATFHWSYLLFVLAMTSDPTMRTTIWSARNFSCLSSTKFLVHAKSHVITPKRCRNCFSWRISFDIAS